MESEYVEVNQLLEAVKTDQNLQQFWMESFSEHVEMYQLFQANSMIHGHRLGILSTAYRAFKKPHLILQ